MNAEADNDSKLPARPAGPDWRLVALVAAHLVLTSAVLGYWIIPGHVNYLPLLGAIGSVPLTQTLLLSFWMGMGAASFRRRIFGGVLGVLYIVAWQLIASQMEIGSNFVSVFLQFCFLIGLFSGAFLAVRHWVAHLQYFPAPDDEPQHKQRQFSILHLLLLTTVAALVLGLARGSRGVSNELDWSYLALMALFLTIFLVNTLAAIWATLAPGPVRWRLTLVLLTALLLGIALFASMNRPATPSPPGMPALPWWIGPSQILVMILVPLGIIVVSLLVVRSCGYRLVSNRQSARAILRADPDSSIRGAS